MQLQPFCFIFCLILGSEVENVTSTYMELNMPIKAVKQKPMANMDFMRTYKKNQKNKTQQWEYNVY